MTTIFNEPCNMYKMEYDFINQHLNSTNPNMLNNKLFATFTNIEGLDTLIEKITKRYDVLYQKVFIFEVEDKDELVVTYNVDYGNVNLLPENTILVHRKKESNTLYTINALNKLIISLNGGVLDKRFKIEWSNYKNNILLTQGGDLKILKTKLHKIINL